MTSQTPMSVEQVFDGYDFRTNEGPESTDYFFNGHLAAVQIADLYYAIYPEHRAEYPYVVDADSIRQTWQQFTAHADNCYLVTGDDEEPGPLDFDEFFILCTCESSANEDLGTGYEHRHVHASQEGQPGAIPVTWVSIPRGRQKAA
ncbi:hypothetical protein ACIQNU_04290 [Streptomyces sp. NPDC091292]|uniref:hypothetical protein n=1 Tax=Streptomyces sp. NPDC091292 TaxID=3365991 RepID=UPI00381487B8